MTLGSDKVSNAQSAVRTAAGELPDEDLMEAFAAGDQSAFECLVRRHQRGLFNFLLRSLTNRSRSEDLLQEVFLRVVKAKSRYQRTAKFTTWLYTIARNLCVDESRRQRFRRANSLEQIAEKGGKLAHHDAMQAKGPASDALAMGLQIRSRVEMAISGLPVDQREVFHLRQGSGLSFKEIAEIVGVSENTVKSRMRYALEKLRVELSDLDPRVPLTLSQDAASAAHEGPRKVDAHGQS